MDLKDIFEDCKSLWDLYQMLPNIREHSLVVAEVAFFIGKRLTEVQNSLSLETVVRGALMHDIAKGISLKTGEDHCKLGREICERHGLWEIGEIVEEHVRLKELPAQGQIREKHIVCYADKRVMHNRVVSLEKRLSDILVRYAQGRPDAQERILQNFSLAKRLEELIFQGLGINPLDLQTFLEEERPLRNFMEE